VNRFVAIVVILILASCSNPEENARGLYNKALTELREGRTEEAEKLLKQVVAEYPQTETATKANEELSRKELAERIVGKIPERERSDAEAAALANLRTINIAEVTFLSSSGGNYGTIIQLVGEGLLDASFLADKFGYRYVVETDGIKITARAEPVQRTATAKYFYAGEDAVVRYEVGKPAGQSSPESE